MSRRYDPMGGHDSPDDKRRSAAPEPLAELLGSVAARRGWMRRLEGARVHTLWTEIAGEELATHVQPVRLHGGVLVVRAESPAWATQVRYLGPQLAARANEVLGEGHVRQVTVVVGPARPNGQQ